MEEKNELDLLDVLKSIGDAIKKGCLFVVKGMGWLCRLVYKYKFLALGCMVVAALVCVYQNRTKVYKAEADLKLISFQSSFIKNLLDPLNAHCAYADTANVSRKLNIPSSQAAKIRSIKSYYYVDLQNDGTPDYVDYENKYDMNDTTMSIYPWKLKVEVELVDTSVVPGLDMAIEKLIAQNNQVKKENELRLSQLNERIEMVDQEIALLDSLRKREYFQKKKDLMFSMDKTVMLNEREMKLYHNDLLELEKMKQDLSWERTIYDVCVFFENGFEVNPRAVNRWSKTFPKYLLIGLLISIGLAIFNENKKAIKNYLSKEV